MKRSSFASLKETGNKGAANGEAVGSRRGKTTERSQEVAVAQQLAFLALESKAKSHGDMEKGCGCAAREMAKKYTGCTRDAMRVPFSFRQA